MKAGPRFEAALAAYYSENTPYEVERRVQGGSNDRGDLGGIRNWVVEAKATGSIALGPTMNEAQKEARNARADHFVAVHNRKCHALERSYATVELWEHARLLRAEHYALAHGWPG